MIIGLIIFILIYFLIALLVINYPKLSIPISIILLPLERFNIYIGFTIDPIILFLPILFLTIFVNYNDIKKVIIKRKNLKLNKTIIYSLIFIIVSIFLSDIFSISKFLSLKSSLYIIINIILIITSYYYVIIYKDIKIIINSLLTSTFIVSIYGIFQFFGYLFFKFDSFNISKILYSSTINPNTFITTIHGINFLRPDSTFTDVNTSAGYLLLIIPLLLVLFFINNKDISKYITKYAKYIAPIIFIYFIFTFSEAAIIGLMFSVIYILIALKVYKNKNFKYYVIFLILILLFMLIKINLILKYFYYKERFSYLGHYILVKYSYLIFTKHIIFGTGIGTFSYYFGTYIKPYINYYYNNIDNPPLFLLWLSEIGIIGFISYMYFFFNFFKNIIIKINNIEKTKKIVLISLLSGFIGIVISNFFHSYLTLMFNWEIIGLFLGISVII
jgi:hypothetical protein